MPYLKRPEIYNRVDEKMVFRPFCEDTYKELIRRQIARDTHKFREMKGTEVEVMEDVVDWLTGLAQDSKKEGARCVPRIVTTFVVTPVIDLLTKTEEKPPQRIVISKRGGFGTIAEKG